jgi:4-diphosphocytidyl-2-C-methyl-D-erythritol kinase
MLSVTAPAKINLFLHVGGRRADGFHALESLVCFAEAADVLRFETGDALKLRMDGPFALGLAGESDNLVLRAARALAAETGLSARATISLTKSLPVASGIGGGSADAAAALRGLMALWGVALDGRRVHEIALSLGSDVPVCLKSVPAIMTGRGENLRDVGALPPIPMLLVNPGVAVSTGEVFRGLARTEADRLDPAPELPSEMTAPTLLDYLKVTRNDMEAPARQIAPLIGEVLDGMRATDAVLARMCGSGATCYALFDNDDDMQAAADALSLAHPKWWVKPSHIAPPDYAA